MRKKIHGYIDGNKRWRQYLKHDQFIIKIDHKNLEHILQQKIYAHLQNKVLTKLIELRCQTQYTKCKENIIVDDLSRIITDRDSSTTKKEAIEKDIRSLETIIKVVTT